MSNIDRSNEDILLENEQQTIELQTLNTNVAKESKQDDSITQLTTIAGDTTSIDGKVSTEAKQDDIITAISAIGGGDADTGSASSVARSATSVQLLTSNASRVEAIIRNDSNGVMYIELGSAATVTSAVRLRRQDQFILQDFTGVVNAIWDSAGTGNAVITETTIS